MLPVLVLLLVGAGTAAPAPARPEQTRFRYPEQTHGGVRAGLEVVVADRLHVQGLAGVTLTTRVEGGAELEVQPVQLSDTSGAWQVQGHVSAWMGDPEQTRVGETLELIQTRPGPASLPAIAVRFRSAPDQPWNKAEWSNLLGDERDVPPPEGQQAPPSPWLGWLPLTGGGVVGVLLALAAWRLARRRPSAPSLSAAQKALAELAPIEQAPPPTAVEWAAYHTRLADILRRYLAERLGIPALEQSSSELLTAVCQHPAASAPAPAPALLRRFLEVCDQAKFAPQAGSSEDAHQALQMARSLLEHIEQPAPTAAAASPAS